MPQAPKLQPALFGGLFIGVLSALPFVNIAYCCCLWVIGGGMLAAYLMQQNHPYAITAADGALVGMRAGGFGGVLGVLRSMPVALARGPLQQRLLDQFILNNPDVPAESKRIVENMAAGGMAALMIGFKLMFSVIAGLIFGMLGGLLGVALFKKDAPPPPPGTVEILPPSM
jgi:hypothetical protein